MTQQIEWADGSGDKIYITANEFSGNQQIAVSSDPNTGAARSKVVTFSAGNVSKTLTVEQAAGTIPGGDISDYVQDGLFLLLDGKEKGNTDGVWKTIAGTWAGYSFTNYGATFNSDNVSFDGIDDYLRCSSMGTATNFPQRTAGTIEIVCDNENFGLSLGVIFIPKTAARLAAAITSGKLFQYGADSTSSRAYKCPIVTLAKSSLSASSARRYENGVALELSSGTSYLSGISSNYYYIGRNSGGNYFKGKIYSIRIYSKQLSESEVLQNLAVDNIRFNLGLTL